MRIGRAAELLVAAVILAAGGLAPGGDAAANPLSGRVFDVAAGREISQDELVEALARSDVAILGEVHDNPWHHAAQEGLVRALAPRALAFEMIPPELEGPLERLRAEGAPRRAVGEALRWSERGWPDWELYAPILEAAPGVPVTGGEVAAAPLRAAMRDGAEAAARATLGAAAARYDVGGMLSDSQRAQAAADQVAAHCGAIPESVGAQMVEAQILRDVAFADAALRARAMGADDGGPVVLIAGAGHARRDLGAPRALLAAEPGLSIVSLALLEHGAATDWREHPWADAAARFDYVWFFPAAERDDPCDAFRARSAAPRSAP
ncbi:ChaN family lipoprotein [Rubrimonas cliftonensis]|uniref:Uncharacterized iron-regulated protein n=1 Tax=Rubrimonas cliftonensis TaxID=89524 RepID=A0A1H3Z8N0_9RHOB|nr:ChaN family lipoprotein [Rubrimonas cliftonensis]SEA19711.1 Uncharacterized iron-regulated protein [Rubrimonas cliftonensis]